MAVNKNFVVKNGIEVGSSLIVASAESNTVGVGTTVGQFFLDVRGSIGATDLSVSGVGTIVTLNSTNFTGTAGTIGNVQISSGIVTASSGIVTYYGDGQFLSNVISGIGIRTEGSIIGYGVTLIEFRGAGISTITTDSTTGIGTINITGGGGGASISIGTVFSGIATNGNLWYKSDLGRLFIYYQDADSAQWVDASPFNIGIITSLTNVSYNAGSAISPSIYFNTDPQTGWFSPALGNQTFVSAGSSILNVNPSGINVTGVITATSFSGIDETALKDSGGTTIVQANPSGIVVTGIVTSTSLSVGGLTVSSLGVGIKTEGSIVGYGATMLDFRGAGISTITIDSNSGISTINITGGGGGGGGSYSTILALS